MCTYKNWPAVKSCVICRTPRQIVEIGDDGIYLFISLFDSFWRNILQLYRLFPLLLNAKQKIVYSV